MGNQKLKRVYVFDRQRLMNADQKFKRKWGLEKDGENDSVFPAFSSIFSQFKETKASFDSQRRRMLRDNVKTFFRTRFEARRSRRLTDQGLEQARKTFYSNRKR